MKPRSTGVQLRTRRRAILIQASILLAAAAIAVVARDARVTAGPVDVAIGLFAAQLTAVTIVLALLVDIGSRWPALNDIVVETLLFGWFVVSLAAVALAVFASETSDAMAHSAVILALVASMLAVICL